MPQEGSRGVLFVQPAGDVAVLLVHPKQAACGAAVELRCFARGVRRVSLYASYCCAYVTAACCKDPSCLRDLRSKVRGCRMRHVLQAQLELIVLSVTLLVTPLTLSCLSEGTPQRAHRVAAAASAA